MHGKQQYQLMGNNDQGGMARGVGCVCGGANGTREGGKQKAARAEARDGG